MTLTEYLAQPDPVFKPRVDLQEGEYREGITVQYRDRPLTQIFINAFPQYEYARLGTCKQLFGCDEHGNPKGISCFFIS